MPITETDSLVVLAGVCPIEEAETLLEMLRRIETPAIDLGRCEHLHAAVLQTLLASRARIAAPPPDKLLARLLCGAGVDCDVDGQRDC
jgi:hypothetical protein